MRANDLVSTVLKKIIIEQVDDTDLKHFVLKSYEALVENEETINLDMELDNISRLEEKIDEIKRELYESETNGLC